jgi:metallo-beta-lactamase class B
MKTAIRFLLLGVLLGLLPARARAELIPDPPKQCASCEDWNAPQEPFRIFGNTYYVGPKGLSVLLIDSGEGLILLDGALPQSAALVEQNLQKLGFRLQDVRFIASSHAHYDHVGGIAALQRASGAEVVTSPAGVKALAQGEPTPDDPQAAFGAEETSFPRVQNLRPAADGETLKLGDVELTAHWTPGHTPGGTSWSWRSCEGERCLDVVYADSLTAVSAPDFRFTAASGGVSAGAQLQHSIERIRALPCDILMATHPEFVRIPEKLQKRSEPGAENPFIDPSACRAYADAAARRLEKRLSQEAETAVQPTPPS